MNMTLTPSSRAIYSNARSTVKSQKWRRYSESPADGKKILENLANVCYSTARIPASVPTRRQYGL
jgi:hypothetical protein